MSTKYEDKKKVKSNFKISRKSNKKTTSKIVNVKITEIKPTIINKKTSPQTSNLKKDTNTTKQTSPNKPQKNKRAIKIPKAISTVKSDTENTNKIEVTPKIENSIENIAEEIVKEPVIEQAPNIEQTPEVNEGKNSKRVIKLNTNQEKNQEVYKKPDTSINQNSSFFYTPSIFSRYNINITSVDDESNIEKNTDITNQETTNDVTNNISENTEHSTEEINPKINNSENTVETDESIEDEINIGTEDLVEDIDISDISFDDLIDITEDSSSNNILNEASNNSPEINTESQNKNKDNNNSYLSKVKKGIFSNISSVFKKFSYEQNEMMDINKINIIINTPEQTISVNNTSPVVNNVSIDMNSIDFEDDTLPVNLNNNITDTTLNDANLNDTSTNTIMNTDISLDDDNMFNLNSNEYDDFKNLDYSDINLEEDAGSLYDESNFSIEDYFGVNGTTQTKKTEKIKKENKSISPSKDTNVEETNNSSSTSQTLNNDLNTIKEEEKEVIEKVEKISNNLSEEELSSLTKLLNNVNEKINSISNRLSEIENTKTETTKDLDIKTKDNNTNNNDIIVENTTDNSDIIDESFENNIEDIDLKDINLSDLDITQEELDTLAFITEDNKTEKEDIVESDNNTEDIENILSKTFSIDNNSIDEDMKNELLTEILTTENEETNLSDTKVNNDTSNNTLSENDEFFTIIDTLAKTITQLENSADINNVNSKSTNSNNAEGKTINILINKDDIFSISILNETYEIVADFDGISVLSENINISTPKKNFYVTVGEKYIEIHNNGSNFLVNTNFEDIEFANAINNVAFTKKNNKIELTVKEAFKLSSVNNKVELSMLNTSVADMKNSNVQTSETINEASICDNRTLLISEETQKVYLPYTIEELMQKLNNSDEYQTLEDVIENEYTVPLSTFKMPIVSRFKEAYKFMRTKEHSSVYAALDLALELMFNSNLNPAVIRASKDLKELNVYLDCLYENEIDKFDCFKIVYKVLPKIQ